MYFLRTVAVKKFCCLAKLCTADNRIVNHQKALVLNQFVHRDQFHSGDQVSLALLCRHERTRPGRCIFDKRTGKRYTGTVRITDRMGDSRIRDTGYNVRMHLSCISLGEHITTFITHFLYIDTFVGRSRISIVYPEEGTDTHLFSWFLKRFDSFRSHKNDLARSQRFLIFVSKINVCMALKRNTACILLASDDQRCTSQAVSGCDQSFRSQKQHRHRTVDHFLCVTDPLCNRILGVDKRCDHFCRIYVSPAHFKEMCTSVFEAFLDQFFHIVDLADCCDRKIPKMRTDQERLWFII